MQRLTIERLALGILFILLFAMAVRIPLDTDTWWHLRSGEMIVNDAEIPKTDTFSHTRLGDDWIDQSWASQIILYGAYKLTGGGDDPAGTGTVGLALFTAILATGGMAIVYRMCAGNVYNRMFVIVIGAAAAAVFWTPRPQMFSFFLSTIILYILFLYKYKQTDRLWVIPIMMVFWVNLHAGFAIGFIFLFGFLAGEAIGRFLNSDDEYALTWQQIQKLGLITVVGILALSINPYGPQMILYPFRTAGIQVLNLFIQEWQSPDFKLPQTWPTLILFAAIIILGSRTRKTIAWSDMCLAGGTAILALWAARNMAVFAVVATPILSRQLDVLLEEKGWQITPSKDLTPRMIQLNWALIFIVFLGGLAKIGSTLSPETVQEAHEQFLPVDTANYLRENPPQGAMFNEYNWGGYFIFTIPEIPVFVDGRTDLYDDDFLKKYFRAILGAKEWQEPLDEYNISTVVIQDESALATLLRENPTEWTIVYEDDQSVIFSRIP